MTYVDPRGISRRVVGVADSGAWTAVSFECGHTSEMASHFCYKIGSRMFCFQCGKEAASA